jgi:DNA polymerase-1
MQTAETGRWKSARPNLQNLCVDAETEFLTKDGWVMAPTLTQEHEVAEFWPENESIDFVNPKTIVQEFTGKMLHITTQDQIDLMVTPDHRCLFQRRKRGMDWFVEKAANFPSDVRYPQAGMYAGGDYFLNEDEITFLCAVQADGSYVKGGGIVFTFRKRRKIERMRSCLTRLACSFTEGVRGRDRTAVCFYVGKDCRLDKLAKQLMPDKRFGKWLLDLDRFSLDCLTEEVLFWDGLWTRRTEYFSTKKENADWVQIVWLLSGWRAKIREHWYGDRDKPLYCVDTSVPHRRAGYSMTTNFGKEEIQWDGPVYCVTVPSSFVVIRRNGKVSVTGNSKTREKDYKRILGSHYVAPLRSVITASLGHVLVEADYVGAELYGAAIMSGDKNMIAHCQLAQLPEDHPDFFDIHSNVAKLAFRLDCPSTKAGLKSLTSHPNADPTDGMLYIRNVAKTVAFGVLFGRGAAAIATAVKAEGVAITVDESQVVIDTIFQTYPGLRGFFEECRSRSQDPKWIIGCFGRHRRFPHTGGDKKLQGDMERQAMNFPIQGMIADTVSRAIDHLYEYRYDIGKPDLYKIVLQIHDAIVLEVPIKNLDFVYNVVMEDAMCKMVPIVPSYLDGTPTGKGPYHLGVEKEVFVRWGVKMTREDCERVGINPERYAH